MPIFRKGSWKTITARAYLGCVRKQHRHQSEVQAALLDELILDLYQQEKRAITAQSTLWTYIIVNNTGKKSIRCFLYLFMLLKLCICLCVHFYCSMNWRYWFFISRLDAFFDNKQSFTERLDCLILLLACGRREFLDLSLPQEGNISRRHSIIYCCLDGRALTCMWMYLVCRPCSSSPSPSTSSLYLGLMTTMMSTDFCKKITPHCQLLQETAGGNLNRVLLRL